MTEMNSLITLLRQIAKNDHLGIPWSLSLFGSSRSGPRTGSDIDLILVYKPGNEEMARKFRADACREAWNVLKLQLDVTLLNEEEEESLSFVSKEGAIRILESSETR
ncbi:nucleotidyltransferase domain-containing protein [Streptomyces sp. P9-A4]|uniref:nucleotidyltransferase domain-containing protein n=1 Tax=Streptomyces sp. P9-A4 TaxID=3072285 RepID=UPI003FCC39C7